ncbi:MAG: dihydroxy-acid dehydratase [Desulfobacterales bacterium]|nr:dihydroxy-acid dehydratase [Desulfobacterales bacterium]
MTRKRVEDLRSHRWFGVPTLRSFGHRSRMLQMGYTREEFTEKPIIAVINTWSEINCCHTHFKQRAEEIKRGVWQAGGIPIEMPVMTLAEAFERPTPMLHRNLLAMEVEQILRHHPFDGVVLMGGCDKTTPALIMGSASMNLPTIFVPAGPMLKGNWCGEVLGSGSDAWKYWEELRAGTINECQWREIEEGIARSPGLCMTMGTGMTMTSLAETLGLTLPGASTIPAVDSNHNRMASSSGRRIVDMVWEDIKINDICTAKAYENVCAALMAFGGSTNAFVHLIAMARRSGIPMKLDGYDKAAQKVPVILNLRPSGTYLAEDWYYAGGCRAALNVICDNLHLGCSTVNGKTLGENIKDAHIVNDDVIRPLDNPIYPEGGTAILYGNLAPDGAVIKGAACDPRLLKHKGPALVFDSYDEMADEIDRDDLEVTPDHILILRNAGPKGGPGMPEWGMLPIPKKLLKQGVRDMLRLTDARMSGTSYGACILHVAPESYVGGPLALVQNGDIVSVDVGARNLELLVTAKEMAARQSAWKPPIKKYSRSYTKMYIEHVTQANDGCDFDFLEYDSMDFPEPEIH